MSLSPGHPWTGAAASALLTLLVPLAGCELVQPEVVIQNDLPEPVQISGMSFNGGYWPVILAPGEATSPRRCLPGDGQVHFLKFDAQSYFNRVLEVIEKGGHEFEPVDDRIGWRLPTPLWYAYQTTRRFEVEIGGFYVLHVEEGEIEQDFSVPGPYGH